MEYHLWEAYTSRKISVDIQQNFKNKLRDLIRGDIYKTAKELEILPARLYNYFIYQNLPIPLISLINLAKKLNINMKEIEQNIILYKQMFVPNKNSIKNPKLPIRISPYFTSIIAHLYFDGSVPKDGKGTYYNQKSEEIMDDFISKLKEVFGDVQYTVKKDHRGVLKCRVPRIIGEICKTIYEVNSFFTFDSKIPSKLFKLSNEHKKAFVLAAISDEGSITYDGDIFFGVRNKKLCFGVQKLCSQIGLKTTLIKERLGKDYYFYIKSKKKLLDILKGMNKKYPLINLRYKKERLEHYFKIRKCPGLRTKKGGDKRKQMILTSLEKGSRTINMLTRELLILPKSVRRHLSKLILLEKVKREKRGNHYLYTLTTPHCLMVDSNSG